MKNSKSIISVLILLALSLIPVSAQEQRQASRTKTRQISGILQRLQHVTSRFSSSLNAALIQEGVDEMRPQNDINSFKPAFESAINQFRDQFTRRRAVAADVQNIMQNASLINGFMTRNPLNSEVRNDWLAVRAELNVLANAYGLNWQWNRRTPPPIDSRRSARLSDTALEQLISRIDAGGDSFRSSLTNAFDQSRYDRTGREGKMNDAVQAFKSATNQLRNQFDAGEAVEEYVERLLGRATPIDTYMRANRLTDRVQNDWATVRVDLNKLAAAYDLSVNLPAAIPKDIESVNRQLTWTFPLDALRTDNLHYLRQYWEPKSLQ